MGELRLRDPQVLRLAARDLAVELGEAEQRRTHKGYRLIGVDLVPERLQRVRERGIEVVDLREHEDDLGDAIREMTAARGPDSVVDAVGMEAHGSPATTFV